MRLVTRLTVGFLIVVICVISLHEYRQFDEAQVDFENDMDRAHRLVAGTLADAVERIVPLEGLEEAMKIVDAANQRYSGDLRIRWVCRPGHVDESPAPVDCATLDVEAPLSTSEKIDRTSGLRRRFSLSPLRVGDAFMGAIEVSESVELEGQWETDHFYQAVRLALMTTLGMTLAAFVLGVWLVAQPTRALMEKARAVGRGELEPDLILKSDDELSAVADEMNAMCRQLAAAQLHAAREAAARVTAVERLRHADRLATVGRLASGLAHELGTPLNVVEARAGFIADDLNAEEGPRNSAKVIIQCVEQMTRLIKQLLTFARPRTLEPVPIALEVLARTVVDLVEPLAQQRRVTLRTDALLPAPVRADEVLVQQAVTNVVVNAILASSAGGTVEVSTGTAQALKPGAQALAKWSVVQVKDEGVGMSPQVQAQILEPFFTTRPPGEGTGLGLPITLSILEDHGGFLTVKSAPGQGSLFTLHFPAESA